MPKLDESKLSAYVAGLPVEYRPQSSVPYAVWSDLYACGGSDVTEEFARADCCRNIHDAFGWKCTTLALAKHEVEKFADLLEEVPNA